MHWAKKGNAWHFGMRAHIGADAEPVVVHSLYTKPANESGVAHTHDVLHGQKTEVFVDAGCTSVEELAEFVQAQAEGKIHRDIRWSAAPNAAARSTR